MKISSNLIKSKWHKRLIIVGVIVATFAMATSGLLMSLGGSTIGHTGLANPATTSSTHYPPSGTVTVMPAPYSTFVKSFSPFNPDVYPAGMDQLFYEPLYQVNVLNGATIPWLATGYNWSNGYHTLTFNLRTNVHYSNGALFNSTDVNVTFQLEKKYPALDTTGVWDYLSSVSADGPNKVIFNFTSVAVDELYYIESTLIIYAPQFESASNVTTFTDPSPIGTGPYVISSVSSTQIVLTANLHYWQPDEPHIKTVIYNAYTSNTAADEALAAGDINIAALFAPNMSKIYVSKDPTNYGYYFAPTSPAMLWTNDLRWPLNETYFRQALSMAINRTQIYLDGEYGYEKPASLNMIPGQIPSWVNSSLQQKAEELSTFNVSGALSLLNAHGYHLSSGSLYAPNGTKVPSMTIQTVSGYTDYDADISLIASDLKAIGISVTVETPIYATLLSHEDTGNFWLLEMYSLASGPNPSYTYTSDYYDNGNVTPIGSTTSNDVERWNSSSSGFASNLTTFDTNANPTVQYDAMNNMTAALIAQMPSIPLVYAAEWYEWNNKTVGGFPTASNYYWLASAGSSSSAIEVVMLHLYSKVSPTTVSPALSAMDTYIIVGVIIAVVAVVVGLYVGLKMRKGGTKVPRQPKQ